MGEEASKAKRDEHQTKPDERVYRVDIVSKPFDWRDGLYVIYILATAIAALVAWRALVGIKNQGKWMERQLDEMKNAGLQTEKLIGQAEISAQAAQRTANALFEGQRPQIAMRPHGNPGRDFCDVVPHVQLSLHNMGLTTAYDCNWESWTEIIEFPFIDFSDKADYIPARPDKFSLYPKDEPVSINIPLRKGITKAEEIAIKHRDFFLCIRVRVRYRDSAGPMYANFGVFLDVTGFGFLPKYNNSGQEAKNDH